MAEDCTSSIWGGVTGKHNKLGLIRMGKDSFRGEQPFDSIESSILSMAPDPRRFLVQKPVQVLHDCSLVWKKGMVLLDSMY